MRRRADAPMDERIPTFRWAVVNQRHDRKRHLWLGTATACGIGGEWADGVWALEVVTVTDEDACRVCRAYAQGWFDRHDHGPRFKVGAPSPQGADTVLGRSAS